MKNFLITLIIILIPFKTFGLTRDIFIKAAEKIEKII